jgi:glycine/D-amino acid oxidase-like deaminating enzyme
MQKILIIGGGLAGSILAAEAYERGISFKWVVSENIPAASLAAYGMCNPIHFHNIVSAWKADEFFESARSFYKKWESKTGDQFYRPLQVNHLIADDSELTQWRQQVESTDIWKYTTGDLVNTMNPFLHSSILGSVPIHASFFVDIGELVTAIKQYLIERIIHTEVTTNELELKEDHVIWKGEKFEKLIFAEGSYGSSNPYFSKVPFNPCKGEILILKIPGLQLESAIHKKIVLVPIGGEKFMCGATYEWDDLSFESTEKGKNSLLNMLKEILSPHLNMEVVDQKAGVRPTISDRRPAVGWHPLHPQVGILNGFGTKGLMLGPGCVANLLNNFQNGESILPDWDLLRFKKRLLKSS